MEVLRLVLVDDYRMVTEALAARLSAAPDLWVAGSSQTDDPRLPEIIRWLRPDIVLIDVEPLGFAVGEVLGRIRAAWPAARIIIVTADGDTSHAVEAARAGADAWVSKSQGADQLETVLRGVARGHSWYPPEMLGDVLRALRDDVRQAQESGSLLDTLSPRELDVLTSMAKGKRARQIAAELMISADTVRTHTRSIFGKLEVHSRIEAVSVAWAAGLRPADPQAPASAGPRPAQPLAAGEPEERHRTTRRAEPVRTGRSHAGPGRPGAGPPGPGQAQLGRPGPGQARSGEADPIAPGPAAANSSHAGPGRAGAGHAGAGRGGPGNAGSGRSGASGRMTGPGAGAAAGFRAAAPAVSPTAGGARPGAPAVSPTAGGARPGARAISPAAGEQRPANRAPEAGRP